MSQSSSSVFGYAGHLQTHTVRSDAGEEVIAMPDTTSEPATGQTDKGQSLAGLTERCANSQDVVPTVPLFKPFKSICEDLAYLAEQDDTSLGEAD